MPTRRAPLRILFSCVGRRVELVEAFRAAGAKLRLPVQIWGTDQSRAAPAMSFVDRACPVPPITDPAYIDAMFEIVRRGRIALVVPVLDLDLLALSLAKGRFESLGCTVLISDPKAVATCRDKML